MVRHALLLESHPEAGSRTADSSLAPGLLGLLGQHNHRPGFNARSW